MRQQQGVAFLTHSFWRSRAQDWLLQAFVRLDLIQARFDLLALVVALDEVQGGAVRGLSQVVARRYTNNQRRERDKIVRVLFEHTVARWVRESRYYYIDSEEETTDGLLVTLRVRQESEIVQWLLSWGKNVYVLEPASLRQLLTQEAQIVQQYAADILLSQR